MSEVAAPALASTVALPDKRPQVEMLLADVFKLMDYPAKLDFKDMADGSLGVAVHFDQELPGISAGKQRSYLIDCVQFWLNKVVNRPNVPRRWVNLGVNAFPEPRQAGAGREQQPPVVAPPPSALRSEPQKKGPELLKKPLEARASAPAGPAPRRPRDADERTLAPPANPTMSAAGALMAHKAVKHGRLYGVMLLTPDARALMLKAAETVKGVSAKVEGEGHWRRLVFVPEKLTVISKKQVMPDYDDEGEDE